MVMSRYSATLLLLSAEAAAKNNVLASATAIAASTAKLATTGQVSPVRPDLSAPSAVAARWTRPYILEPISRLRCAAARVTVTRWPPAALPAWSALGARVATDPVLVQGRQIAILTRRCRIPVRPRLIAGVVGHPGMWGGCTATRPGPLALGRSITPRS